MTKFFVEVLKKLSLYKYSHSTCSACKYALFTMAVGIALSNPAIPNDGGNTTGEKLKPAHKKPCEVVLSQNSTNTPHEKAVPIKKPAPKPQVTKNDVYLAPYVHQEPDKSKDEASNNPVHLNDLKNIDTNVSDHPVTVESLPQKLSLIEAEETALKNSHTLKSSQYALDATHQQIGQWLTNIYPSLSFSTSLKHSGTLNSQSKSVITDPGDAPTTYSSASNSRTTLNANLTARQTILDLTRKPKLRQAELSRLSQAASFEGIRQDVLLEVRKAWFQAYIDQDLLRIKKETVDNRKQRLNLAQGLYKGGTKARVDVATAQSDLAQAKVQAIKADTQLKLDWVTLNFAMGLTGDTQYSLEAHPYWETIEELNPELLVRTALANRTELQVLKAKLSSKLASLEQIEKENSPTVAADASLGGSGSISPFEGTWSIGVSLNWTLFDGYLQKYQISAATLEAHGLAEDFEDKRLAVFQEVTNRIVLLRQAQAEVPAGEVALALSKESYRLAAARYKVGVGNSQEVSDAELALEQAKSDLALSVNNVRVAKAELIRAVGVDSIDNLPQDEEELKLDSIP